MDRISKLFLKISKKDRALILELLNLLDSKKEGGLNIVKIKNTDFYRLKKGNYRVIFHREQGEVVVDSIRLRDEKTYKSLR
jgi:mRNA-degrading endonuclease RelE of RelBE toxin-antitoxin system